MHVMRSLDATRVRESAGARPRHPEARRSRRPPARPPRRAQRTRHAAHSV